ncbi:MAG TPA: cytochrome c3 family protein [Gemmatimonadales bacterium]|nr:cytochrome c3 family protein [Gemmatimonadales bacterium]HRZ09446.1 cytochrome c3 family protein [Gemmatimonadales bacterium]
MTSRTFGSRSFAALLGTLALVLVAACTETNTEYVERPQFNPPPDSVNGFMGYYDAATRQTTCGNCHSGYQGQWVDTKHADAYDDLVNSGHAASYCYGCHTVSGYGNSVAVTADSLTAGYNFTPSTAYHDVQCESCHGPGFEHVSNPNSNNHPMARAGVYGMRGAVKDSSASCGGCHSGTHEPFIEQWAQTGHADSAANAYPAGTPAAPGCGASCHEGRTALARFNGEPSTYVEKDSVGQTTTLPPATCAVCHDPHGSPYQGQLRAPIDVPDVTLNLCMSCHNRSTTPSGSFTNSTATTTVRGSHSAQGPVLLGEGAGYIPAGFIFDTTAAFTTHSSSRNPRLCAGCHVTRFTVTDEATGGFQFQSVGHLFSPNPCLDANGVPTADNNCAYLPSTTRNWSGCVGAGCHATQAVAASALSNERTTVQNLVNQLWNDVNPTLNNGAEPYMDAGDSGDLVYLLFTAGNPTVNGTQAFNGTDSKVSPAEGALYNAMMLAEDLYGHNDGSFGVHNPFFYEALLAASIAEVQSVYAAYLPAPPSPSVRALMDKALRREGVRYTSGQSKLRAAR